MRIVEILLPKGLTDRGLSAQSYRTIDKLQSRMDQYVDKICGMAAGTARDFLKSKLKADYASLKDIIQKTSIAENELRDLGTYEVYDTRTGQRVAGPYSNLRRASHAADKLDLKFGASRYAYRPVKKLTEAIYKLPLTVEDFDLVKKLMERPIPAAVAPIYIMEIIEDDELNDQFKSLEESDPGRDVRPLIVEWFRRVMPDQMHRFGQEIADENLTKGILSPIHGYDPKQYKGSNEPITGNAYGMF